MHQWGEPRMMLKHAKRIQDRTVEFSRKAEVVEEVFIGDLRLFRVVSRGSLGESMARLKYVTIRTADGLVDYIKDELMRENLIDKQAMGDNYQSVMNRNYLINIGVGLTYEEATFRAIEGLLKRIYPLLYEIYALRRGDGIIASERELRNSGQDFIPAGDLIYYTTSQRRQLMTYKGYSRFNQDDKILWIYAENLIDGRRYLVPAQYVINNYMRCIDEPIYRFASVHGISIDVDRERTLMNAIMDCLAKDSFFAFWYGPAKIAAKLSGLEKVLLRDLIGLFLPSTLTFYIDCYRLLNEYNLKFYFGFLLSDENRLIAAMSHGISTIDAMLDFLINLTRNIILSVHLDSLNLPLSSNDFNDSIEHLIYYYRNTEIVPEAVSKIREKVIIERATTKSDRQIGLKDLLAMLKNKEYVLKLELPLFTDRIYAIKVYIPKLCEPFVGIDQPFLCPSNVQAFPEEKRDEKTIEEYSKKTLPHPLYFF